MGAAAYLPARRSTKCGLGERANFACLERPPRSGAERSIGHWPYAGPDEADHRVTDGVAHAADLAIAPLVYHEANHARRDGRDTGRSRRLTRVEHDSLAETPERSWARGPAHLGEVLLLDAKAWMREQLSELAVVREQQQTLGRWSRRPTEKTRVPLGTRSSTVGRPCGSSAVVTTPAGLFSR